MLLLLLLRLTFFISLIIESSLFCILICSLSSLFSFFSLSKTKSINIFLLISSIIFVSFSSIIFISFSFFSFSLISILLQALSTISLNTPITTTLLILLISSIIFFNSLLFINFSYSILLVSSYKVTLIFSSEEIEALFEDIFISFSFPSLSSSDFISFMHSFISSIAIYLLLLLLGEFSLAFVNRILTTLLHFFSIGKIFIFFSPSIITLLTSSLF